MSKEAKNANLVPAVPLDATTVERLRSLFERAKNGDPETLPELREVFQNPAAVELCGGNLAKRAEQSLVEAFAGKNLAVKEVVTRKLELLREELAGPNPTPLERLLVERVAACWLHLHHLEATYAGKASMTLELGTYYQRSIDRAQKRYLSAIKTLATIRRLALPALQVNIAQKQQVNNASP